jgi:two-component system chemotaxis response regulator CheB
MARVLIVDDSVFMRTVIRDMLSKDPAIEVVGSATDGVDALEKIRVLSPDLITLDIEMPKKNGIEVLQEIGMKRNRPRILMLSTLTSEGAEMTRQAIRLGADDFMPKPKNLPNVREIQDELISKIKHLIALPRKEPVQHAATEKKAADRLVLIGSSAGGPQMLDVLLSAIPENLNAAVIVTQHMPIGFTAPLADRFNRISPLPVKETDNGDVLQTGKIYISKAGFHTIVSGYITEGCRTGRIIHSSAAPLHGVRPAVDKTFESAAQVFGRNIISVILSGMGNDAGEGAKAIKDAGGTSVICDEKDCLVYGMARSAISQKAVDAVLPLDKIAGHITKSVNRMEGTCV